VTLETVFTSTNYTFLAAVLVQDITSLKGKKGKGTV